MSVHPLRNQVEEFASIVRRYCQWAESPARNTLEEMQTARSLLAALHQVIFLPDLEAEEDVELEDIPSEQWHTVCKRFSNLPVNRYWMVFDPLEAKADDTVYGTLFDDLSDIYRDIKYGLRLFEEGHVEQAVWDWRFNFKNHWGWHLLEAQKVVHFWFFHNADDV